MFFFAAKSTNAAQSVLMLNEIYPCSTVCPVENETEAIELINTSENVIDLHDYTISDKASDDSPTELYGLIEANSYLVLEKDKNFSFDLNIGGEEVTLKKGNEEIDSIRYGVLSGEDNTKNAPKPEPGKSISRYPDGYDSDNNLNDWRNLPKSLGFPNIKPAFSDFLIMSEILPSPESDADGEFIEIYNKSQATIVLDGWKLDDSDEGSAYTIPDGVICGLCYLVFYKEETKVLLNDDGDAVKLLDPNGDIKSIIEYQNSIKGKSYANFAEGWEWSAIPTPGAENERNTAIKKSEDTAEKIIEVREKDNGMTVVVEGQVTVLPKTFSDQYFYIQDDQSGIQVYSYYKIFPTLSLGDQVRISGVLSENSGERRIKISSEEDIVIINPGIAPVPIEVPIEQIGESYEGMMIETSGEVEETSGSTFVLRNDQGSKIKVVIKESTQIRKPKMRKNDSVLVTGVLSQNKNEYRILPVDQDDVIISNRNGLPAAGPMENIYLKIAGILELLWNLSLILKKKLSFSLNH